MNVSLSRKIHIIALPHGTRNVCLSEDQSVTMVSQAGCCASPACTASCAIALRIPLSRQQQREQAEPDQQQPVPIRRAKLHAHAKSAARDDRELVGAAPNARDRARENEHAADQVNAVPRRDQDEERKGWVGGAVVARRSDLPPGEDLAGKE